MSNALWIKPDGKKFAILTLINGSWQEQQDTVPEVTEYIFVPGSAGISIPL